MTYVFINKENHVRIKMIEAPYLEIAIHRLKERLSRETKSGEFENYELGYHI